VSAEQKLKENKKMSIRPRLVGKVARVLNSREIAINLGLNYGIKFGMLFDVVDPKGEEIVDPETREILGSLERAKVRVKVIAVYPKMSVASTYKTREINVGGSGKSGMFAFEQVTSSIVHDLLPPKWIKEVETLKTTEKTWENLELKDSYVKIGDPVVEVIDPTE
jgi:hypothetical protein